MRHSAPPTRPLAAPLRTEATVVEPPTAELFAVSPLRGGRQTRLLRELARRAQPRELAALHRDLALHGVALLDETGHRISPMLAGGTAPAAVFALPERST